MNQKKSTTLYGALMSPLAVGHCALIRYQGPAQGPGGLLLPPVRGLLPPCEGPHHAGAAGRLQPGPISA